MSKVARANVVLPRPRGEAHGTTPYRAIVPRDTPPEDRRTGRARPLVAARATARIAPRIGTAHTCRTPGTHGHASTANSAWPSLVPGPVQRSVTRASGDRDERDDGADARKRRACRRATPPEWRTTRHRPPPPLPKFGSGARIPTAPTLLALADIRDSGDAVCCGVHDHIAVDHAATSASARSTHNGAAPAPRPGGSPGGIAPFMGGSYCPPGGG